MIVVVEGPSGAGKTTWLRQSASPAQIVAEHGHVKVPAERIGDEAKFWADLNAERWQQAEVVEASSGSAFFDGDPLKLHYDYCLARIGLLPWERFEGGVEACRSAIRAHRLGLADIVFCSIPDDATLDGRKQADPTRRRSNFAVHRRLGPALHDWYSTLEQLGPERIRWTFPTIIPDVPPRARFDLELYDTWITRLPGRARTAR